MDDATVSDLIGIWLAAGGSRETEAAWLPALERVSNVAIFQNRR
jgi:hypothetical protein